LDSEQQKGNYAGASIGKGMKKSLFGKMLSNLQITRTPFFISAVFDDGAPGITV
jgi:preprotein translocase subunit SecG